MSACTGLCQPRLKLQGLEAEEDGAAAADATVERDAPMSSVAQAARAARFETKLFRNSDRSCGDNEDLTTEFHKRKGRVSLSIYGIFADPLGPKRMCGK